MDFRMHVGARTVWTYENESTDSMLTPFLQPHCAPFRMLPLGHRFDSAMFVKTDIIWPRWCLPEKALESKLLSSADHDKAKYPSKLLGRLLALNSFLCRLYAHNCRSTLGCKPHYRVTRRVLSRANSHTGTRPHHGAQETLYERRRKYDR
jgi:hypothetical protein